MMNDVLLGYTKDEYEEARDNLSRKQAQWYEDHVMECDKMYCGVCKRAAKWHVLIKEVLYL